MLKLLNHNEREGFIIANGHIFLDMYFYYFIEDAINNAVLNYLIISTLTIQGDLIRQTN